MGHTLHEMMLSTKANEYLMAVGFLVAFGFFWSYLFKNSEKKKHD